MHNILKKIIEKKRVDLIELKQNKFRNIFGERTVIIGEIKLVSPTVPYIGSEKDIIKKAADYEQAGIDAISIITEKHFFKGSSEFITRIKKRVRLPILQKDFIINPIQIYEAKIIGADALLLIAKIIDKKTLIKFVSLCQKIGLEPVVEINNESDLKKAMATSTKIIAVNARDLETFNVDVDKACLLMKKIPDQFIKLGFSGIKSSNEVKKYQQAGAKGVLVGTSLMKADNVKSFIDELRSPRRHSRGGGNPVVLDPRFHGDDKQKTKVKICGIRTFDAAQTAVNAGADFLGFNLILGERRYVRPEVAKEIINKIRSNMSNGRQVKIVGVFQNNSPDYINKLTNFLDLDYIQLHEKKIIKSTKNKVTYLLVDRKKQGTGLIPNLDEAEVLAQKSKTFFAGGLDPNNIEKVIKVVRPYGVDVSGGIETNGQQDNQKIKKFISRAKGVLI